MAVTRELADLLPGPLPRKLDDGSFDWVTPERSIGRVHGWHGNALALARAFAYIIANGADGLARVSQAAVLNANWLLAQLRGTYTVPYDRPVMHEVVVSTKGAPGVSHELRALDVGKRLLEKGFHAPTVYFPLIVPEALMIEPTETESPETVAALAAALVEVAHEDPELVTSAPRSTPIGRADEARAARSLVPTWDGPQRVRQRS